MKSLYSTRRLIVLFWVFFLMFAACGVASEPHHSSGGDAGMAGFPMPLADYHDASNVSLLSKLAGRVLEDPFNLIGTIIFILAIAHTFLTSTFMAISHRYRERFYAMERLELKSRGRFSIPARRDWLQIRMTLFHFLGEVEAVFGIWLIPLALAIISMKGIGPLFHYVDSVSFTEPIFVVAIMAMASSRPILRLAEAVLAKVASLGKGSPMAWWLSILTVGPLLGSLITEPAAMTICALLLVRRFFLLQPSFALRYATLGLLFVNISVGGTLDHFAAPPVVMVASEWGWDLGFMFVTFGWKSVLGILVSNGLALVIFRKELAALRVAPVKDCDPQRSVPIWLTVTHCLLIAWIVYVSHHPAVVVLSFLFYLAFVQATERHQDIVRLRSPLLVGFFLASLVIHGGLQAWWIEPVLSSLTEWPLFFGAVVLTAFNDNAAITYLASLVPGFTESMKIAVVAGAVTGGGLTVIANAPNPAGQSILQAHFGPNGVNPGKLLLAAIPPTILMGAAFMLLP